MSFPGLIIPDGSAFFAYIYLVLLYLTLLSSSTKMSLCFGFLLGMSNYLFFNFWLCNFSFLALIFVSVAYGFYFMLLCFIIKLSSRLFPRFGYLISAMIYLVFEYFKTLGFLGYPYGIIGYSHYKWTFLIGIADIFGVWGVSFLILLISFLFAEILLGNFKILDLSVCAILFFASIFYSFFQRVNLDKADNYFNIALLQHNMDPNLDGYYAYSDGKDALLTLSKKALKEKPDMIVWPETAFVPSIEYHLNYDKNGEYYYMSKEVVDFFENSNTYFLIGNGKRKPVPNGFIDYNSTFLYKGNKVEDSYDKMKLVPFAESFPFDINKFKLLYDFLNDLNLINLWEKGERKTVFKLNKLSFSTPICFEDGFGYISSDFVRNGADLIINVTNDAWSKSRSEQMQHFSMSVFRALENRRWVLRSANSGVTAFINPNGESIYSLPQFTQGYLVKKIKIYKGKHTFYTSAPDFFAKFCLAVVLFSFAFRFFTGVFYAKKRRYKK